MSGKGRKIAGAILGWVAGTCGGGTLGVIAWLVLAFFAVMRKGLFNVDWVPEGIVAFVVITIAGGIAGAYYGWKHFADQEKNTADGTQPPGRCGTGHNL